MLFLLLDWEMAVCIEMFIFNAFERKNFIQ